MESSESWESASRDGWIKCHPMKRNTRIAATPTVDLGFCMGGAICGVRSTFSVRINREGA